MTFKPQLGVRFATTAAIAFVFAIGAHAQVSNSGASSIALNAVLNDSITVSLSSSAVNFTLTSGSANNPGSTSVTATTSWLLRPNVNSLKLYAFFSSSTSALTDGAGNNIPSADFQISNGNVLVKGLKRPAVFEILKTGEGKMLSAPSFRQAVRLEKKM